MHVQNDLISWQRCFFYYLLNCIRYIYKLYYIPLSKYLVEFIRHNLLSEATPGPAPLEKADSMPEFIV